jgi:hypothetical protein
MSGRWATEQAYWNASNGIEPERGTLEGSRVGNDYKDAGNPRNVDSCILCGSQTRDLKTTGIGLQCVHCIKQAKR